MNDQLLSAFFGDLASSIGVRVDTVARAVEAPTTAVPRVDDIAPYRRLGEALGGRTGDLHELFVAYLLDGGRLPG